MEIDLNRYEGLRTEICTYKYMQIAIVYTRKQKAYKNIWKYLGEMYIYVRLIKFI